VHASGAISTDDKVRALSAAEIYPNRPFRVEVTETHLSWVFLAGERVYKLKKPVASEYFDFTSIVGREANCRNEVRLNRRLAGEVYQGVSRLVVGHDGRLAIDTEGELVDWLVVMRRLPADRMLDALIARSSFDHAELTRLVERLAAFYAPQPAAAVTPAKYLGRYMRELATNRSVVAPLHGELPTLYRKVLDRLGAALAARSLLLEQRVRSGRIVDGHGDLRPEHVCMVEPVVIFDCLEFSDELRRVDPVDELAFLGMECAMLGAAWIGPKLVAHVLERLGQAVPDDLVALHTACRAVLRARLSLAHLLDAVPREPQKWRPLAERYLTLGERALACLGF
jgi:aminoglycoside phosphotransferase family enzyme